jgi:hypothetical protein
MHRDGRQCRRCKSRDGLECAHLIRRSAFGKKRIAEKHALTNLITLCGDHHRMEHAKKMKMVPTVLSEGTSGDVIFMEKIDGVFQQVHRG